ncbi:MAG TPA: hypothetical protein VHI77_09310, partial [Solirubrobacterales bacterium]|nr:hypothetical protein [Solirubrobacterales bacterium]
GHSAETHATLTTIGELPGFVADSAAAGFTSLLGLATGDGSESSQPHLIWGRIVLVAAAALVVARVVRERRLPTGLAVVLAVALAFWVSTGILPNAAGTVEHAPTSSRYQLMSAAFLLLILGETLRGARVPVPVVLATAAVAVLAAIGGQHLLRREYDERWRPFADVTRYSLAAVQIAGDSADPGFLVSFPPTLSVTDHTYMTAVRHHGSPAFSEAKLLAASAEVKASADLTIAQAQGLALRPPSPSDRVLRCQGLRASADGATGLTLLRGGFRLENRSAGPVEVGLSRFSPALSVSVGPLEAGLTTSLRIPVDRSPRPWRLYLRGAGPVRLCTLA